MSRRTYSRNSYESGLASGAGAGGDITVDSAVGLTAPVYLVIDPDDPAKREYVKAVSIDLGGGVLGVSADRGLEGSAAGAQTHDAGAKVRSVAVHQWLNDIFDDVEDLEQADIDHVAAPDPHPQYQTEVEGDARYVEVGGDTMTGELLLPGTPSTDATATDRLYVDDADALAVATAQAYSDSLDHDHATPIAAHAGDDDAHHEKYTDDDAIDAVGFPAHSEVTGVSASQHHTKYTDDEAASAARAGESDSIGRRPFADAQGGGDDKAIPNTSTWTVLNIWTGTQTDPGGDMGVQTWTCPEDGLYMAQADVEWESDADGQRSMKFVIAGFDRGLEDREATTGQDWQAISAMQYMTTGQTIEVFLWNNSATGPITIDNSRARFVVCKLSD